MDYFSKNKMLFWCVIILALINIITLISFWTIKPPLEPALNPLGNQDGQRIMEQRLGLSDEQAQKFEQIRSEHFRRTRPLQEDMHKIHLDLLNEIFTLEPNDKNIQELFSELDIKQSQFEKNLFLHFQELKSACNNENQINELKIMLRDLIESTRPRNPRNQPRGPEGNMRRGYRPPPPPNESVEAVY